MKKTLLFITLTSISFLSFSQTTWSDDAAEVIYNNCTSCHNPNGIAPNPLMTYAQSQAYAPLIQTYVTNNIMPPWTADTSYQHYSQERVLSQTERDILLDWINDGALPGDLSQAPAPPIYNGSQQLPGIPDLVITAPNYMSKATSTSDDYVCFVMPSGLTQNKKVRAIEVVPGNLNTVHHCLVYSDPTNTNTTDTIGGDCGGPVAGDLMMGYTPGATPTIFPSSVNFSSGMILEAGSDIIFAMHYPEGSFGTYDQTKVNIYFYDEPVLNFRQISAAPIISDWNFTIPANTVDSVEVVFNSILTDYTLMSVFPHMHLIGKKIESKAITPASVEIPLVKINHWDFEWQDFYWFEYMKKLPSGSEVHAKAIYDNTAGNIHNPNDPPIDISAGLNTSDEMFLIYYHFMVYEPGDENINIDSLTNIFLTEQELSIQTSKTKAYPNPFSESTTIKLNLNKPSYVSLIIYDMQGRLVKKLKQQNLASGEFNINWNGTNTNNTRVTNGIYFYSLLIDGQHYSGKIVKQ